MAKSKVAVTLDVDTVERLDNLVKQDVFSIEVKGWRLRCGKSCRAST